MTKRGEAVIASTCQELTGCYSLVLVVSRWLPLRQRSARDSLLTFSWTGARGQKLCHAQKADVVPDFTWQSMIDSP